MLNGMRNYLREIRTNLPALRCPFSFNTKTCNVETISSAVYHYKPLKGDTKS